MSEQGKSSQQVNSHPLPFVNCHDHIYNLLSHTQSSPPQTNTSQFIATLQWKSKTALATHDVDLVAILVNKQGAIHDVCFFNNLNGVSGLKHGGDDRNGNQNLDANIRTV